MDNIPQDAAVPCTCGNSSTSNSSDSIAQPAAQLQQQLQQQQQQVPKLTPMAIATQPTISTGSVPTSCANVVTIPVPIVQNEETYAYITVKGSLHDRTCSVFGLNDAEIQALSKRFDTIKPVFNGVMVSVQPIVMLNSMAQLGYKVVAACGEAEICWTMQREI